MTKRGLKLTGLDRLLLFPHVHTRNGAAYVRISYQTAAGKWKAKERRVANEDEALAAITSIKQALGMHGPAAFDGERMTWAQLIDEYERERASAAAKWYLAPLRHYFGARLLRSVTYGDCRRFRESRAQMPKHQQRPGAPAETRKPATINREMEWLRAVLLFAVKRGWLLRNPLADGAPLIHKADEEHRDRIPTPDEINHLLSVCVPPREHLRALIIGTLDTGLRKSALLAIEWARIDFERELIKVPRGNRYKGRPKIIVMTARLKAELIALRQQAGDAPTGKAFGQVKDFGRSYDTACRLAGVVGLRFNDLRHGFATDLMEAGVNERLAMKMAGHSNPEVHAIYTNTDERLARQVAQALDQLHMQRAAADSTPFPLATELLQ